MMQILFLFLFSAFTTLNAFQFQETSRQLLHRKSAFDAQRYYPWQFEIRKHSKVRTKSCHYTYDLIKRPASSLDEELEVLDDITDADVIADDEADAPFDYTSLRQQQKSSDEDFFNGAEMDADRNKYLKGTPDGFYVTKQYSIPEEGFDNLVTKTNGTEGSGITQEDVNRLEISGHNITLSIALMLLDGEAYPSLSRARKSCRKGYIVVNRGPLIHNEETGQDEFDKKTCFRGRVIDRVYPGDVIGVQCRMHGGFYPGFQTTKPPFELPVVYEDDHFAIVNKPPGVVTYAQRKQSQTHGIMTVRAALPFVLKPPRRGTMAIIRRPASVHRLDKPTSGLLLVAKTKPAMVHLSKQFSDRTVKKTYVAIINGVPSEPVETSISTEDALKMGVSVDRDDEDCKWQIIDHTLDEKSAVTVWKPLEYVKSLKAKDGVLTLVEMKPKTGRYHQLRRHMSWVKECPIVGDSTYDGGGEAMSLRGRGLFLCSNRVTLEHPYFNTAKGRAEWDALPANEKWADGILALSEDGTKVKVHASIDLPNKFQSFLAKERKRSSLGDDQE